MPTEARSYGDALARDTERAGLLAESAAHLGDLVEFLRGVKRWEQAADVVRLRVRIQKATDD